MNDPKVSIVMTSFNRAHMLQEAIGSVLQQEYSNWELIVFDDGSKDETAEVLGKLSERDSRIRYIESPHVGRGQAIHQACQLAGGDFIGILDSDDRLVPSTLSRTVDTLNSMPEVGMLYSDHCVMNKVGAVSGVGRRCLIPYSPDRLLIDFMTFHFRLMRRGAYERVGGFDPSFKTAQDYDLCLRLSEMTKIFHLREALYLYRKHDESISVGKQYQQIQDSQRAVQNAIVRRGLDQEFELDVRLTSRFQLKRKNRQG